MSRAEPRLQYYFNSELMKSQRDVHTFADKEPKLADGDIEPYFKEKLPEIVGPLLENASDWPGEKKPQDLVLKAQSLLVWATTTARFIVDPEKQLECILSSSGGNHLDNIYRQVLERACPPTVDESILSLFLNALVVTREPMNLYTLASLLSFNNSNHKELSETIRLNVLRYLQAVLIVPGIDTAVLAEDAEPIQFIHSSFVDYRTDATPLRKARSSYPGQAIALDACGILLSRPAGCHYRGKCHGVMAGHVRGDIALLDIIIKALAEAMTGLPRGDMDLWDATADALTGWPVDTKEDKMYAIIEALFTVMLNGHTEGDPGVLGATVEALLRAMNGSLVRGDTSGLDTTTKALLSATMASVTKGNAGRSDAPTNTLPRTMMPRVSSGDQKPNTTVETLLGEMLASDDAHSDAQKCRRPIGC
ncbi:hypothetical protein FRB98_000475 [Tulasnella sp. 332]|nr:hypothetical protein FRB98_000475 [Tulasnella sp. 332]